MSLGLSYEQLMPVAGNVRAGVVSYDGSNPEHRAVLRDALPRFLGSVAAVHGESFPYHCLDSIMEIVNAKEIQIDFLVVGIEACRPITLAGLATSAQTFGVEWDKNNNLKIFPVQHGEDLCVDKDIAKLFREHTRSTFNPDGIGAGTWFMREQIRRSVSDPDWVFAGRDNEHSPNNPPIIGLMDKFGAVRGTEQNSAVLQIDGLTGDMERRWGVNNIQKLALPTDPLGLKPCSNNFLTSWESKGGAQQIAVVFTKLPSILDGQTVVWTKIKSNGNLPENEMLKEVLSSLLSAGSKEISERQWGVPRNKPDNDLSRVFGGPVPVMHIHGNNEPAILKALLEMEAAHRKYGHGNMVSGVMNLKNMSDPVATLGQKVPEATLVKGIDMGPAANEPYFDVISKPEESISCVHAVRPRAAGIADNDNLVIRVA